MLSPANIERKEQAMKQVWEEVKKILGKSLTSTAMDTWFSECEILEINDTDVVLAVADEFRKTVIEKRFLSSLKEALKELLCADYEVFIITRDQADSFRNQPQSTPDSLAVKPEMDFDHFVVGESNRLACSAAKMICDRESGSKYNPLFLYGGSGLGKTHLLNAIINEAQASRSTQKILYCRGDDFINRMCQALQMRQMSAFHEEFRSADILLLDDVEFLAGKQATQEEVFNTFNAIIARGGRVILTSDRPPRELSTLEARLRTRFEGGIIAEIRNPDQTMREEFIRRQFHAYGITISDQDIVYIAENVTSNFRQISGVVKSICVYGDLLGNVTRASIDRVLSTVIQIGSPRITPEKIIQETARYFAVKEDQIRGNTRERKPSSARQTAMYLCRSMLSMTLNDIGEEFGKRDHATVISSIRKVTSVIETDNYYKEAVNNIQLNLKMA